MKGKKKGSSLVLVLIFVFFFTAISSVVVLAVVETTKANSTQEIWEDNYYVAEAAIETAIVKASKSEFNHLTIQPIRGGYDPTKTYEAIYDERVAFDGTTSFSNKEVDVKVIKSGDKNAAGDDYVNEYFLIEVTAKDTNKGQPRTIKATIAKSLGTGDMFKYMICGKEVYVKAGGAGVSDGINSQDRDASITIDGSASTAPTERAAFTVPEFNFNTMTINEISGTGSVSAFDVLFNMGNATGSNGVVHWQVNSTKYIGSKVDVYLVNMPSSNMNLKINAGSSGFSDAIILTNGNIEINVSGAMTVQYGSIVGKGVRTSGAGSMTLQFPPFGGSQSRLNEADLVTLNREIAAFTPNWDASGSLGGSSGYWDTVEYK